MIPVIKKLMFNGIAIHQYPKSVQSYSILVSVNGGSFTEVAATGTGSTSFTINDFTTDAEYCFIVRANLEGRIHSQLQIKPVF